MSQRPRAVCLLGHHEPDYPRNRSVREALEAAGFRVVLGHSRAPFPWRHFILAAKILRLEKGIRWIVVTEGGHRLVPMVKLLALLTGRKVLFDPFISRYNTRIEDRRLHAPGGLEALICLWQDWSSTHAADFLVFDTEEHRQYFYGKYRLGKPSAILPVGVDEAVFHPRDPSTVPRPEAYAGRGAGESGSRSGPGLEAEGAGVFQVLFYGTYIPLQGVEWILEAAALLREDAVRFTLVGRGQTYGEMRSRAEKLGLHPQKVAFLDPVSPEGLIPYLVHADLSLGIFGDTAKAAKVVPNKVVQAAAMGKAVLTRDSPAIRGYFRDGENILLVPAASGQAIASAIRSVSGNPGLLAGLGQRAREVFSERFSVKTLAREFGRILPA